MIAAFYTQITRPILRKAGLCRSNRSGKGKVPGYPGGERA
jgi:hypothetical protein